MFSSRASAFVRGASTLTQRSSLSFHPHRPATSFRTMATTESLPIYQSMQKKITENLKPARLYIENESYKHAGHSGNPKGGADAETHFKVEVVSDAFEGKNLVTRHRMIYQLLDAEIKAGVHALALNTKTPSEVGM